MWVGDYLVYYLMGRPAGADHMKNLTCTLMGKKTETGKRYWISVSKKESKESSEYITANLPARLSKTAEEYFAQFANSTKNPEIRMIRAQITDGWLTVIPFKAGPEVGLMINAFEIRTDPKAVTVW